MAETIVLAQLSVDSTGVVRGVAVVRESLDQAEGATDKLGQTATRSAGFLGILEKRMFSLRTAAIALLGTFTLAGLILQLVDVTKNLITGSDAWKNFMTAARDAFNELVRGEGPLARTARHLQELAKGTGIELVQDSFAKLAPLLELRKKVAEDLAKRQALVPVIGIDAEGRALINQSIVNLNRIDAAIVKIQKDSGVAADDFAVLARLMAGVSLKFPPKAEAPFLAQKMFPTEDEINGLGLSIAIVRDDLAQMVPILGEVASGWELADEAFGKFSGQIRELESLTDPEHPGLFTNQIEKIEELQGHINDLIEDYENFGAVASAAFDAVSAAAQAGVISQSAAARIQMAILAIESILKGKIEVAEAAAAAARYDYVSATLHGIAAGLYFAAAAFYGKGAAFGQATAAGRGGAGFGVAAPAAPQPQRVIYVTQNFNGPTFGYNEAEAARYIKDLERRGERSND